MKARMRTGNASPSGLTLVVEGGGLRGAFSAGVMAALDRMLPRRPDTIYATSSGAPSAAYLAAGQIEIAIRIWETRTHDDRLVSPAQLLRGKPPMRIDDLVECFRTQLPLDLLALQGSSTKVVVAVTHCVSGRPEYLRLTADNALRVLHATMALPIGYGRVVDVAGAPYVDGGITESIPLEPALALEGQRILVVLTRHADYRKARSRLAESIVALQYKAYPRLLVAFRQRPERYNAMLDKIRKLERDGRLSVIRPTTRLPASRTTRDRERILQTLQQGRRSAVDWFDRDGQSFLSGCSPAELQP